MFHLLYKKSPGSESNKTKNDVINVMNTILK